jgi:conserved oligomeric Golgi complex subunit 1
MAAPDLSTLTSSSEIFSANYTLPQIRSIHKAVHVQIDEKASRLRTQVGGSYRELLGTADAIVRMRADNDAVQTLLGRMGARCGRAVVGKKVAGLDSFVSGAKTRGHEDPRLGSDISIGDAARIRLLEACGLAVGRLLRGSGSDDGTNESMSRGDRLVLATKVFVLSRLLIKSIGEEIADAEVKRAVEIANRMLASLRRKLLRSIDRVLDQSGEDPGKDDVLKALCAYSLANSSGARDVLWHFLLVRGKAMALAFDIEEHERERSANDVLESLVLYTRTLLDVQGLVPFKLSEALLALKKHALLADEALKQLGGLRLDIYERWCGDEIQFFTPFIRHDDLDGKQAKEMLGSWATKGAEVLIQGLKRTIERMSELKAIMELRTNILQLWIREGGKAKGFDPSEILDQLRTAINTHMLKVLETKVNKLRLVGSEVSATLEAWQVGITDQRAEIWDEDAFDMDLPNGAANFLQDVIARIHGRNDAVSKALRSYQSWHHVIGDVGIVVEQLRKQRWDNDIDEIEDEETIEARQQLLSRDDPQGLQDRLDQCLERAFKELDAQLTKLWDERRSGGENGAVAMYFLRILRDIRVGLPNLGAVKSFGLPLVPSLHETLAQSVACEPLDEFSTTSLSRKSVAGRSLWEGDPPLPNQPTPGSFAFLRNVSVAMMDAGADLWSPTAVGAMKRYLSSQLCELWLEALATRLDEAKKDQDVSESKVEQGENTGDEDNETDEANENDRGTREKLVEKESGITADQRRDLFIQWLFDISLLRCGLGPPTDSSRDEFKSLEEVVYKHTELESATSRQRIIKASQDSWKRTNLLFGFLALP